MSICRPGWVGVWYWIQANCISMEPDTLLGCYRVVMQEQAWDMEMCWKTVVHILSSSSDFSHRFTIPLNSPSLDIRAFGKVWTYQCTHLQGYTYFNSLNCKGGMVNWVVANPVRLYFKYQPLGAWEKIHLPLLLQPPKNMFLGITLKRHPQTFLREFVEPPLSAILLNLAHSASLASVSKWQSILKVASDE